jgi:hypothetical protein
MTRSIILIAALGAAVYAQDSERIHIPFSDPSRPKMVQVSLVDGSIHVHGYDGADVQVEPRGHRSSRDSRRADGMRRIYPSNSGVLAEEQDNVIRIKPDMANGGGGALDILVPRSVSLQLKTVNGGDISVEGVSGELDVNNTNGAVKLTDVSGAVVAHATNGKVLVTFDRVMPNKPMSFSSVNGTVDVTLPSDFRANVRLKTQNGSIYSDFVMQLSGSGATIDGANDRVMHRVRPDGAMSGTINGGGAEMRFTTLNGNIYIRKRK